MNFVAIFSHEKKVFCQYYFIEIKFSNYNRPTDPAVNPTIKNRENSSKSLGKEFINKFKWVI